MSETEQLLRSLEDINLDDELAYEKILIMLEANNIILPVLTQPIPKNTVIYRSRENENTETFNSSQDIACPRKEYVKKYNRANRPFQSIFYGSNDRGTCYSEFMEGWLEKPLGTVFNITIGQWLILENLDVIVIHNRDKLGAEFNIIKGNIWDDSKLSTNDFLVNLFSQSAYKNKSLYVLTSAIANTLLIRSGCDGILYPSVPRNGIGLNLALKSEVYEKGKLKLEVVCRETFITVKKDGIKKTDHASLAIIDGRLKNNGIDIEW